MRSDFGGGSREGRLHDVLSVCPGPVADGAGDELGLRVGSRNREREVGNANLLWAAHKETEIAASLSREHPCAGKAECDRRGPGPTPRLGVGGVAEHCDNVAEDVGGLLALGHRLKHALQHIGVVVGGGMRWEW